MGNGVAYAFFIFVCNTMNMNKFHQNSSIFIKSNGRGGGGGIKDSRLAQDELY